MKKPLILVFCSNDNGRLMLRMNYSDSVISAGGIPLAVPMRLNKDDLAQLCGAADGFLFAGGVDVDPSFYGEQVLNDTVEIDPVRDALECAAVPLALSTGKPLLGICRGIQSVNVFSGGSLYQDIPSQIKTETLHRQTVSAETDTHYVDIEPDSLIYSIAGCGRIKTNSFHHQAVKTPSPLFRVTARAEDGVIEAMEGKDVPFALLVQWHPEFTSAKEGVSRRIFSSFIEACSKKPG